MNYRTTAEEIEHDVNALLEESFGRGFKGNYHTISPTPYTSADIREWNDSLDLIAKRGILGFGSQIVGRFDDGDKLRISVHPDYEDNARFYAAMRMLELGEEVTVTVDSSIQTKVEDAVYRFF